MSYLFDIEDFLGNCRAFGDNILKQITTEVKQNKEIYFQTYGTYDGYKPTQNTLILNSDGSTTIWLYSRDSGGVTNFNIGQMCCEEGYWSLSNLINKCKTSLGLFQDVNITQSYWDSDNQTCRWKPLVDGACSYDAYKIELNPVGDDGALFNVEKNDKSCNLTIDFSYLFKFDCETLSKTLITPDTDPKILESKKQKEQQLAELKIKCETLNELLENKKQEFNETPYSIFLSQNGMGGFDGDAATYCINEENGGLAQLEILLGPLKYLEFIQGSDSFNMTDTQTQNFLNLNNESVIKNNLELIYKCSIPYGTKSILKKEIDEIIIQIDDCSKEQTLLENDLSKINDSASRSVTCSTPINVLETFDVSVTLDVVESDGSLTTVSEYELLPTIGEGNLYQYLVDKQDNSGFYFCSLPKSTETWTTGCTSLIAYELTSPSGLRNTEIDLNVSTCNTIKNSLLNDLLFESPFGSSENDKKAFYETLNKQSFASNWVNFTQFIDDEETINKIINKKIKLSLKINNSCTNVCVYIDNIKLTKECVTGENKKVTISKSPGFEIEKIIDNKKSWVNNIVRVDRKFHIENINNLSVFRNTDYTVDDERLVINTKEIDLNINIPNAIENDVQCYISDNPDLLNIYSSFCESSAITATTSCGITNCGDGCVSYSSLTSTNFSNVTDVNIFKHVISTELIDVKNRKTIQSYATARGLYDRYLHSVDYNGVKSSEYDYDKMDGLTQKIGDNWIDVIEQLVPATTIWGSVKVYGNTIFDQQKFQYKLGTTFTCINNQCNLDNVDFINNCMASIIDKFYTDECTSEATLSSTYYYGDE